MEQFSLAWVDELKTRYQSGESVIFLLHGNVSDVYPWYQNDKVEFVSMDTYLRNMLKEKKDLTVEFTLANGFRLQHRKGFNPSWLPQKLDRLNLLGETTASIHRSFQELEKMVREEYTVALILEYCETVLPDKPVSHMSEFERSTLVKALQWTQDSTLNASDNIIIFSTEQLSMVHRRLLASSQVVLIDVPLPSAELHQLFVTDFQKRVGRVKMEMGEKRFAEMCGGLTLMQMQSILKRAYHADANIDFALINERKKKMVEQECQGLVEFVAPKHNFSHVGGADGLKSELKRIADAIKKGRRSQVPMGMLFVGPMGTGKTYIAEAFAGESGLTCIKLKNFREKWVGSTEGNFDKILQVIKALGNVLLIIDEADRSLSGGAGDGGVDSRVIAKLKEFMSDTQHRGRILVVMMTNRPDKIDIDLKRPGRLDSKIPFFFPDDPATSVAILQAQVRKHKVQLAEDVDFSQIQHQIVGYSAAEIESVLIAALRKAGQDSDEDNPVVSHEHLLFAGEDVVPTRDRHMIEYMELMAVFESSSRVMLPEKYKKMGQDQILGQLQLLRSHLGDRL